MSAAWRCHLLLARAGFRRQATYRLALAAGIFTNTVFGLVRASVMVGAIAGAGSVVAGYDARAASSYVWWGQMLLGSVGLWGWTELAERVRTGDIAADFLRPLDVQLGYLSVDLGRGTLALLARGVPMLLIGGLLTGVTLPAGPLEGVIGLLSVWLAMTVAFLGWYLVNCAAFWVTEIRGLTLTYTVVSSFCAGLYLPVHWFPGWLAVLVRATPFPAMLQTPVDVLSGYAAGGAAVRIVAVQLVWIVVLGALGRWATAAGRRRLEVQGG